MQDLALVAVNIRSAHNVGSFLRTCDGFSASLILTGITPYPVGSKSDTRLPHVSKKAHAAIAKTALGAENTVNWEYISNPNEAIAALRKRGFHIAAIEQSEGSIPLLALNLKQPTALIVGPEVTGLDRETLKLCDAIYEIPMSGKKESFNVSVAAAIALYQARL